MIRILHLTDFHSNKKTQRDWANYLKEALLEKLLIENEKKRIDLIVFTGDLIDIGGKDYGSATNAFEVFKTEIIMPILSAFNLPIEKFLIIPGNHDINRDADLERSEIGSLEWFKKDKKNISSYINDAINNNDFSGMERVHEFKDFEKKLYSDVANYTFSMFGSSVKYNIYNEQIGVSCLNSSWRCYNKDDSGNIIIGDEQLIRSVKNISDCYIKIALAHHPLDWISTTERRIISSHIYKDYDLLLLGHVHENKTSMSTGFTDSLFINVAPSGLNDIDSDSRIFSNGFTIIDFDKKNRNVHCIFYRYNHNQKEFVLNTDLGDNGELHQVIPNIITDRKDDLIKRVLKNICEDNFLIFNKHLIANKDEKEILDIKDRYISPPITQGNYSEETNNEDLNVSVTDVIKSNSHQLFYGNQESGKTILLYRLIREYIDEYDYIRKIPVYIDVFEMRNKEILTCIKEYLKCNTEETNYLLNNNKIIILFDNLNFNYKELLHQINRINIFSAKYENIQIIATAENYFSSVLPIDYIENCKIGFKFFFIHSLKTKQIKSLMKFWVPTENEIQSNERIEKMVDSFRSYALPSTAMSVSLFLWSTENKDRKPINHAVLMDIYIEIILQKLSEDNIYREKFDYLNKCQLLAKVAQEMVVADGINFSILQSDLLRIVENYLKNDVAFDFDAKIIVEYFLKRKIFVKYQSDRIKFTYSCFLHFFIAKRMEYNPEFKAYITADDIYYKYYKAIDYYTGNFRSDEVLLDTIHKRFLAAFVPINKLIDNIGINFDLHFTDLPGETYESVATNMEVSKIKDNRPTEDTFEKIHNNRLSEIPDPNKILKQQGANNLELMLIIMSNTLRNSEGVENKALKKSIYDSLIKNSMNWMVLYREYISYYYVKNRKLPKPFNENTSIEYVLKNTPYHIQLGMKYHLSTQKLSPIILEKILQDQNDRNVSDIESFLSVALYSDVQGRDYPKYLKNLIKKVKDNIVRDYIFYKLINYYYKRTRAGSPNEIIYLDLLFELRIRFQKGLKRIKETIIKSLEDGKRKYLLKNPD